MKPNHELERRLTDFYASEAPPRAPDRVLESVLALTDITTQRRAVFRLPWRFPIMNSYARIAIAAVAVIAIGAVGVAVLRPGTSPGVGGQPTASPSLAPSPSVTPTASAVVPPALTKTFTSPRLGYSIAYPAGWLTRAATQPWTTDLPDFGSTAGDVLYDPTVDAGHLWIVVASQPIGASTPPDWIAARLHECAGTEPTAVDGASGLIGAGGCNVAAVTSGGRGYIIWLYTSGDDASLGPIYDRTWFDKVLATVQLRPKDAADVAPSASP